ncbi:hypothetical protein LCGC14_0975590 [marine sediment metagenome]|uniref:Uncharacterized protein n=1 Tax=marine sediment metagenome TaxID=412755 RepID=A0A0F9NA75_9ZZZZ
MKIRYRVSLINPPAGVREVTYDSTNKYRTDPYTPHEHGVFLTIQEHPSNVLFIPWANILHVTITRSE